MQILETEAGTPEAKTVVYDAGNPVHESKDFDAAARWATKTSKAVAKGAKPPQTIAESVTLVTRVDFATAGRAVTKVDAKSARQEDLAATFDPDEVPRILGRSDDETRRIHEVMVSYETPGFGFDLNTVGYSKDAILVQYPGGAHAAFEPAEFRELFIVEEDRSKASKTTKKEDR